MDADKIFVMDNGNIVESGTHSQLLQNDGAYAKLWSAQQNLENYAKDGEVK